MLLIEYVFEKDKSYYLQMFSEEFDYIVNEIKMKMYIKNYELMNSFLMKGLLTKKILIRNVVRSFFFLKKIAHYFVR